MKQIQIGDLNSPGQVIEVADNATIGEALQIAGIQLQASERLASMGSNSVVSMSDLVNANDSYIVTRSHVSG